MHSAIHTRFLQERGREVRRGRHAATLWCVRLGSGLVPDLLLLELDVGVEHAVLHLPVEGELVELHLVGEEGVLERLVAVVARLVKQPAVVL